jgi:rRNA biogenesis protein RRP5
LAGLIGLKLIHLGKKFGSPLKSLYQQHFRISLPTPFWENSATMAPIDKKRKNGPTNESFARSRKPADSEDRPSKRLRPDEKDGKTTAAKPSLVPKISRVREEEAAFPRGGASVLTPLEHKQIQIEATRDVLFEQEGGKSSRSNEDDGEPAARKKHKPKSKGKGKKGAEAAEPEEDIVKIEGLSYKVCCAFDASVVYC